MLCLIVFVYLFLVLCTATGWIVQNIYFILLFIIHIHFLQLCLPPVFSGCHGVSSCPIFNSQICYFQYWSSKFLMASWYTFHHLNITLILYSYRAICIRKVPRSNPSQYLDLSDWGFSLFPLFPPSYEAASHLAMSTSVYFSFQYCSLSSLHSVSCGPLRQKDHRWKSKY